VIDLTVNVADPDGGRLRIEVWIDQRRVRFREAVFGRYQERIPQNAGDHRVCIRVHDDNARFAPVHLGCRTVRVLPPYEPPPPDPEWSPPAPATTATTVPTTAPPQTGAGDGA
jgi:hypothetical protein